VKADEMPEITGGARRDCPWRELFYPWSGGSYGIAVSYVHVFTLTTELSCYTCM